MSNEFSGFPHGRPAKLLLYFKQEGSGELNDERSFFVGDDEDGYWGAYAPWTAWDAASNLTYSLTPSAGDSIRFALPGGLHNGVIDNVRITQMSYADTLFVWGLDLSQSWQGAGGVGGLVAQVSGGSGAAAYYPTYDGNGNISEYLDDTGAIQAHYRYDPFGNTTTATGTMANHFAYRYSTKPWDDGVGGYYYGYRFYNPAFGRWLNRDPIEEDGGYNLYAMVYNNALSWYDRLGRQPETTPPRRRIPRPSPSEIARCVARAGLEALVSRYDRAFDEYRFCNKLGLACQDNMGIPDPSTIDLSGLAQGGHLGKAIRSITSCLADTLGDLGDVEITLEFELQPGEGTKLECACPTEEDKDVSYSFEAIAKLVVSSKEDSLVLKEYPSQTITGTCGQRTWNSCCQF